MIGTYIHVFSTVALAAKLIPRIDLYSNEIDNHSNFVKFNQRHIIHVSTQKNYLGELIIGQIFYFQYVWEVGIHAWGCADAL